MSAKPDIPVPTGSDAPLRAISFGDPAVSIERRGDGTIYLRPKTAIGEYPVRLTDRLHHWAETEPDRIFMAERDGGRGWRQITYSELLISSRHIASSLLARGLQQLDPPRGGIVMIENVGNLVCPALFDLGERAKVVILSVTEGEDKPIKYPHMFRASALMLLNKIDLLPHLRFDVEQGGRAQRYDVSDDGREDNAECVDQRTPPRPEDDPVHHGECVRNRERRRRDDR